MQLSSKNIYDIYKEFKSPLNLLVGAGISVPSPTCLPLTLEITKSLMDLDWFYGDEKFPIGDEALINKIASKVRLEHLLSVFHEWKGHDPGKLIAQFGDAEPNFYHKKIAELADQGILRRIFTTNFDLCIEKALDERCIQYQQLTDQEDYASIDENKLQMIKVHGTVIPANSDYTTKGLISTLESMFHGMPNWRAMHFKSSIDMYGLVCLGYSGNDAFDITPILREKPDHRIVWVFRKQPDLKRYREAIHTLQISNSRQIVISDVTTFFGESREIDHSTTIFKFKPAFRLSDRFHPSAFLGKALEAAGEYREAINYYAKVLSSSTGSNYWMTEILDIFRAQAVCFYELSDYQKALHMLILGQVLLSDYKKRVKGRGSEILPVERKIIMEQELLFGEEFLLTYQKLNNIDKINEIEPNLLNILNEYEHLFGPQPMHRSRLLLNKCSVSFNLELNSEISNLSNYNRLKDDLEVCISLKTEIGDVIGIVLALAQLSHIYLFLGNIPKTQETLLKCFELIRKVDTSIASSGLQSALRLIYMVFFEYFTIGYCPVNTMVKWDSIDNIIKKKFEDCINDLIFEHPIEMVNRRGLISHIEKNPKINIVLRELRDSLPFQNLVLKKELEKMARRYGVGIITPDDKILQYRLGLDLIKPDDSEAYYATKYGQWEAIGRQYEKAGDYLQAAASYQNALDGLECMSTDDMFTQDHKSHGINFLKESINRVSSLLKSDSNE